jgi:hypothetical protein
MRGVFFPHRGSIIIVLNRRVLCKGCPTIKGLITSPRDKYFHFNKRKKRPFFGAFWSFLQFELPSFLPLAWDTVPSQGFFLLLFRDE